MQSQIEKHVMASVGAIYIARQLGSATAIKLYVLAISLIGIASLISVPHVFENLLSVGVNHIPEFLIHAILNTGVAVQLGVIAALIAGTWFVADLVRPTSQRAFAL